MGRSEGKPPRVNQVPHHTRHPKPLASSRWLRHPGTCVSTAWLRADLVRTPPVRARQARRRCTSRAATPRLHCMRTTYHGSSRCPLHTTWPSTHHINTYIIPYCCCLDTRTGQPAIRWPSPGHRPTRFVTDKPAALGKHCQRKRSCRPARRRQPPRRGHRLAMAAAGANPNRRRPRRRQRAPPFPT